MKLKLFLLGILCLLLVSTFASAESIYQAIQVMFDYAKIQVNGEDVATSNIFYNSTTYIPLRSVSEMVGKEVTWDGLTKTVGINDVAASSYTVSEGFILHGCYAIESFEQYDDFNRSRTLASFDSLSFGWSKIAKVNGQLKLILSGKESIDYFVPSGYREALQTANNNNTSKQLMIFADDSQGYYLNEIFANKAPLIDQIVQIVDGSNTNYPFLNFDGVTIDFETVRAADQIEFVGFLQQLKIKLGDKKLYVALPPIGNYNHYLFTEITSVADYLILMEHDFDDKELAPGYIGNGIVKTPLSPISKVEADIAALLSEIGQENSYKILLQISFDTTQWGVQDGYLYSLKANSSTIKPYNPSYTQIIDRITREHSENKTAFTELVFYDEQSQNPYLRYYNPTTDLQYYIWYENASSVKAKIELADEYDLGGISLWRLGLIPNYYSKIGQQAELDIWNNINEIFAR